MKMMDLQNLTFSQHDHHPAKPIDELEQNKIRLLIVGNIDHCQI